MWSVVKHHLLPVIQFLDTQCARSLLRPSENWYSIQLNKKDLQRGIYTNHKLLGLPCSYLLLLNKSETQLVKNIDSLSDTPL